ATRRCTLPGNMELTKRYFDVMDPFVTLTAAAVVTRRLKLATAICLVIQRDTIQTAKLVASLDQVSGGRFLFGIGGGWNAEEIENHGTEFTSRFKKMREQIEAMKEIWTKPTAEYHGELVDFSPLMTWPKPVQKPHPPVLVGGAGQGGRGPADLGPGDQAQTASGSAAMSKIVRAVSPEVTEPAPGTWSNCLVVNGVAYVAGMTAGGSEGDEYAQAKVIFTKIR